jgi:hypothetical protein
MQGRYYVINTGEDELTGIVRGGRTSQMQGTDTLLVMASGSGKMVEEHLKCNNT